MTNKNVSTPVNKGIIKKLFKRLIKIMRKMMNNILKSKNNTYRYLQTKLGIILKSVSIKINRVISKFIIIFDNNNYYFKKGAN